MQVFFAKLPTHEVGDAVGDLTHGFESFTDDTLDTALFGHDHTDSRAAYNKSHTHTYEKVSFFHFLFSCIKDFCMVIICGFVLIFRCSYM